HHQRNRYRPLGHPRKSDRTTRGAAPRGTVPGAGEALRFGTDARTARAGRTTELHSRTGLPRFQDRLGALRAAQLRDGRSHRAGGARGGGTGIFSHGGRGRERRLLAAGFQMGGPAPPHPEAYDVHWFEEPLDPDNLHDYVLLRNTSAVPIAGGEVLTRRQSFAPWLQQRAFDIVQPDVTKVGGIGEERRIAWMAEE